MKYKYELCIVYSADLLEQTTLKLEAGWDIVFIAPSRIKNNEIIEYKILYRRSVDYGSRKDFDS